MSQDRGDMPISMAMAETMDEKWQAVGRGLTEIFKQLQVISVSEALTNRELTQIQSQLADLTRRLQSAEAVLAKFSSFEGLSERISALEEIKIELRGAWKLTALVGSLVGAAIGAAISHFWPGK
jgi:hypothetical protein